jgi:hypothetical protein
VLFRAWMGCLFKARRFWVLNVRRDVGCKKDTFRTAVVHARYVLGRRPRSVFDLRVPGGDGARLDQRRQVRFGGAARERLGLSPTAQPRERCLGFL